jgi:hypothetical protein
MMGTLNYFGHEFKWQTHKRQDGTFEAIVTVDERVKVVGVYAHRKTAWRMAKAEADNQLEVWRKIIIIQEGMKRTARKFRTKAAAVLSTANRRRMSTEQIIESRLRVSN